MTAFTVLREVQELAYNLQREEAERGGATTQENSKVECAGRFEAVTFCSAC